MVKCPECGNEAGNNNFCDKCGTKIDKIKNCPNCNGELGEESIFCPHCGEKVKDDTPEDQKTDTEETSKKEPSDEEDKNPEDQKTDTSEKSEKDEIKEEENPKKCPYCNNKINEDDVDFCPECGKPIKVDKQSLEGIKLTIKLKKVLIFSILAIILSAVLSILLSFVFGMVESIDLYPLAFFISLVIIVGIFGSFKDLINGGLLGIITGFVLGLLSSLIVEFSSGYAFSYEMLSGYAAIIFTIFGAIIGIISSQYLRKNVKKYIDVENS